MIPMDTPCRKSGRLDTGAPSIVMFWKLNSMYIEIQVAKIEMVHPSGKTAAANSFRFNRFGKETDDIVS